MSLNNYKQIFFLAISKLRCILVLVGGRVQVDDRAWTDDRVWVDDRAQARRTALAALRISEVRTINVMVHSITIAMHPRRK